MKFKKGERKRQTFKINRTFIKPIKSFILTKVKIPLFHLKELKKCPIIRSGHKIRKSRQSFNKYALHISSKRGIYRHPKFGKDLNHAILINQVQIKEKIRRNTIDFQIKNHIRSLIIYQIYKTQISFKRGKKIQIHKMKFKKGGRKRKSVENK